MKTLILLRHAKAEAAAGNFDDFERALTARGRTAAAQVGEWLAASGTQPDLAFVSTAQRAQQTWDLAVAKLFAAPAERRTRALYLASPGDILAQLAEADAASADPGAARRGRRGVRRLRHRRRTQSRPGNPGAPAGRRRIGAGGTGRPGPWHAHRRPCRAGARCRALGRRRERSGATRRLRAAARPRRRRLSRRSRPLSAPTTSRNALGARRRRPPRRSRPARLPAGNDAHAPSLRSGSGRCGRSRARHPRARALRRR